MAAYAALVSLMNIIDQIHNHPRLSTTFDPKQLESLGEKLDYLLDFVESYKTSDGAISGEKIESGIVSAAHAAEDVIEPHIVDSIIAESSISLVDLQKVIDDIESVKLKVMEIKEKWGFNEDQPRYSMSVAWAPRPHSTMVGFDDYLVQLLEGLTGQQSHRKIISIVGMGGIGKTTLARNVYDNLVILQHFYVRVWVTISQEYDVRGILFEALSCIKKPTTEMDKLTADELGEQLYKSLSGRRYLIVLDDMWSIEAWDKINCFFPDNDNRSRIVVTTRLSNLALHLGSPCFSVEFLDEDKSWDLFCEKAFAQEGCPPELNDIGKTIVKKCKGLPLSIVVIGGLLGKSCKTREYWENIAKDISPIMNSEVDDQWLEILSLSYSHLPACLKPCFLYFGIFPEDYEIRVSQLINLWVGEGFLKPNKDRVVEEVAEGYIKDLIDRNLILVGSLRSNGKFKTCYIHDILRDLCIRVAEKEKFLFVTRVHDTPRDIDRQRRIVIHGSASEKHHHPRVFNLLGSTSFARSLVCEGGLLSFGCRLLRVLLIEDYTDSLDAIFRQVNLRFLACDYCTASIGLGNTYELPSSISRLCNLETIIITGSIHKVVAPSEIWDIPHLRHLEFNSICLPDPLSRGEKDDIVLQNLHTLMTVLNFRCSEAVCKRIPNIKKVHIMYDDFSGGEGVTSLQNVGRLNKIESLYYYFKEVPNRHDLLHKIVFPHSLKKLTLTNCELRWDDLTILGSLPYLEVLKLKYHSVRGSNWNPIEGEFVSLKFLGIYWCSDLINWDAASYHFPALENIVLEYLTKFNEIPLSIGEIATLEGICVVNCSVSAAISTIKILEEQVNLGNQGLQVRVEFSTMAELEEFREKVELESLTGLSFQLNETY